MQGGKGAAMGAHVNFAAGLSESSHPGGRIRVQSGQGAVQSGSITIESDTSDTTGGVQVLTGSAMKTGGIQVVPGNAKDAGGDLAFVGGSSSFDAKSGEFTIFAGKGEKVGGAVKVTAANGRRIVVESGLGVQSDEILVRSARGLVSSGKILLATSSAASNSGSIQLRALDGIASGGTIAASIKDIVRVELITGPDDVDQIWKDMLDNKVSARRGIMATLN